MKKNQGFTIIELLVVIAIIGILAAVILTSIQDARKKNSDAAAKQALSGVPPQSELFYTDNGYSYAGVCQLGVTGASGVESVGSLVQSAATSENLAGYGVNGVPAASLTNATCNNTTSAWAVEVPMKEKDIGGTGASAMFCIDSAGNTGYRANSIGNTAVCPAS